MKYRICRKDHTWNPLTCTCEIDKYLETIIGDSITIYDEVMDTLKIVLISSNDKREHIKWIIIIFCTVFLLVIILLLTIGTICRYCLKQPSKQKNKLPYGY